MASAAIRFKRIQGGHLYEEPAKWEYSLAMHFFDTNRAELAIRIAVKILEIVPDNSHYAVNLAKFKRESRDARGAVQVLQSVTPLKGDRGFWTEWGTACGMLGDFLSNAALHAFSISDDLSTKPPTIEHSKQTLAGLAKAFDELHIARGHVELRRARAACAWLGLLTDAHNRILNDHQQACRDVGIPKNVAEGVSWLRDGLASALANTPLAESVAEKVGNPAQFKFAGLQRLLERSR